jgi:hypothetical protein
MLKPRTWLLVFTGAVIVIAGATAARIMTASGYMNAAADYALAHLGELPVPQPLPDSTLLLEPPATAQAVAHYGDAVEVQITRYYRTARHPEAAFAVTYFYQPVAGGWQLIPAPASFWGEGRQTTGTYTILLHPQRDQKLVDNLVKSIDSAIQSACQHWECPASALPLTLRFTIDSTVSDPATHLAPRLTGLPLTREANDDYLSYFASEALIDLALKIGKTYDDAYNEISRQNLYRP